MKIFVNQFRNSSAISVPGSKINVNSLNSVNREIHFPIKSPGSSEKFTTTHHCSEDLVGRQFQIDSNSDLPEVRKCTSADLGGCTDNPLQAGREGSITQQIKSSLIDKEISFTDKIMNGEANQKAINKKEDTPNKIIELEFKSAQGEVVVENQDNLKMEKSGCFSVKTFVTLDYNQVPDPNKAMVDSMKKVEAEIMEKSISISEETRKETCIEEGEIVENEWDSIGLLDNPADDRMLMKQKAKKDTSTESSGSRDVHFSNQSRFSACFGTKQKELCSLPYRCRWK
ncbi:hypothetical protein MA16_Dca025652 [Dendrobium catenatum]|uniref:Uncharacterized protein n=1 Tax=Dendrobium catenatum TaxID=906689 RepID=A0A2I0VQU1_9ASPA|nr:hypothetical protein MA16_Dca025652 [Dendrobium catenatum]